jgi:FtsP/CotA-like multicopper oxidase with cupredoxin domain
MLAFAFGWLIIAACSSRPAESAPETSQPRTRTYFVAADEVVWDYAPAALNRISGKSFAGFEALVMNPGETVLGRIYKKTVFREYTDATFTTLKPRDARWQHLGILGPMIRAEVGDTIQVVFKNNAAHPHSVHPHGVIYDKASEGAQYDDGTGKTYAVAPGATHTYTWPVPERAGPSHGEGSSIVWMYHSHIDEEADVNAGLVGPMIVTAQGQANPDGSPKDIDREIVAAFMEFDENLSMHFAHNIKTYGVKGHRVKFTENFADPVYALHLRETINGFSYGNTPPLVMRKGERVRWYLFATTNFEVHAPHWHGNTVVARHMRTDVTTLLPMDMVVADMQPDNVGTWLFHCHTGPHLRAGMVTRYTVEEARVTTR